MKGIVTCMSAFGRVDPSVNRAILYTQITNVTHSASRISLDLISIPIHPFLLERTFYSPFSLCITHIFCPHKVSDLHKFMPLPGRAYGSILRRMVNGDGGEQTPE
jgi:hypothetical protein